ncbi:MAG: peptidoglycan DD-metalloendopeptidase family protein [Parvibaculales bacterium]
MKFERLHISAFQTQLRFAPKMLVIGGLALVLYACGPVQSNRWYDSEQNYDSFENIFGKANPKNNAPQYDQTATPARQSQTITAQSGDSYYSLARRYKLSVRDLIDANQAKPPYQLVRGQTLIIPRNTIYQVKKGDTLYSISRRYGTDLNVLARQNNLKKPYHLKVGQELSISGTKSIARQQRIERASITPPARKGTFILPAKGRVISSYGAKANGFHNDGVNIAMPKGTRVQAAENGVVVYAGNELEGYGNLILVKHADNFVTAYAHLDSFLVKTGDKIKRGQEIALSGASGDVDRPQLHFEIRKGVRALNPNNYI